MDSTLLIILAVIVVIAFAIIGVYNSLIQLKNKVEEGWADIDTQLKRRYDLIPNMVEAVKGYAKHEKGTFEEVTKARNMAMKATDPEEKAQAENMLSGALKTLFAVAENYPELKANTNFADLSEELRNTENKISFSRQFYNDSVTMYNTKLEVFPSNIIASMFGFKPEEFFKVESEEARKNVKVDFNK